MRWVQLGAFQPLERLHSHHGERLPWEYPEPARADRGGLPAAARALVPYLYTLAREAHDTRDADGARAVPAAGRAEPTPTSTRRSTRSAATCSSRRCAAPGDPAKADVWFPPGTLGRLVHRASATAARRPRSSRSRSSACRCSCARAGSCRRSPPVATTPAGATARLVLTAYRGTRAAARSTTTRATGSRYERGRFSRTHGRRSGAGRATDADDRPRRAAGSPPPRRAYEVRLVGISRPGRSRSADERLTSGATTPDTRTATIDIGERRTDGPVTIVAR